MLSLERSPELTGNHNQIAYFCALAQAKFIFFNSTQQAHIDHQFIRSADIPSDNINPEFFGQIKYAFGQSVNLLDLHSSWQAKSNYCMKRDPATGSNVANRYRQRLSAYQGKIFIFLKIHSFNNHIRSK